MRGSKWNALAQFELKNAELVDDFQNSGRSCQCGSTATELGDRYGSYKSR